MHFGLSPFWNLEGWYANYVESPSDFGCRISSFGKGSLMPTWLKELMFHFEFFFSNILYFDTDSGKADEMGSSFLSLISQYKFSIESFSRSSKTALYSSVILQKLRRHWKNAILCKSSHFVKNSLKTANLIFLGIFNIFLTSFNISESWILDALFKR